MQMLKKSLQCFFKRQSPDWAGRASSSEGAVISRLSVEWERNRCAANGIYCTADVVLEKNRSGEHEIALVYFNRQKNKNYEMRFRIYNPGGKPVALESANAGSTHYVYSNVNGCPNPGEALASVFATLKIGNQYYIDSLARLAAMYQSDK
ncbi:MAG: hypothetical protein NT051_04880 [Candidatus Micrarchaeota archaeon]|nr:hypothetical protein [Candidatus Micrarchaeota archaeon]